MSNKTSLDDVVQHELHTHSQFIGERRMTVILYEIKYAICVHELLILILILTLIFILFYI